MKPVVLIGHAHLCPLHGPGTVVSASETVMLNGKGVARVGDAISCGALIIEGSAISNVQGRAVARVGDRTDHDGVLSEGDEGYLLE